MSDRPLFLLCNDDGVHAPGIAALAEAVAPLGEVVVVAPHVERSASGLALTISSPLRVEEVRPRVYAVEGSPADCVLFAFRKILPRRPTWVLSGINRGGNMGYDTLHSGTVGAALEARMHGVRAMAVSCQGASPLRYDTAGQLVRVLLENEHILDLGDHGVLNLNVPSLPFSALRGIAVTTLGKRLYEEFMHEGIDPRGRPYFWIGGGGDAYEDIPGSDCKMLDQGCATISILKPSLFDEDATTRLSKRLPQALSHVFKRD